MQFEVYGVMNPLLEDYLCVSISLIGLIFISKTKNIRLSFLL
jgi:hypothetical protein